METKSFDYDDIPAMLRHRADRRGLSAIDYTVDCGLDRVAADEIERLREALRLGIKVRALQRAYFKDRSRENLIASKEAETAFDKAARAALGEGE